MSIVKMARVISNKARAQTHGEFVEPSVSGDTVRRTPFILVGDEHGGQEYLIAKLADVPDKIWLASLGRGYAGRNDNTPQFMIEPIPFHRTKNAVMDGYELQHTIHNGYGLSGDTTIYITINKLTNALVIRISGGGSMDMLDQTKGASPCINAIGLNW